MVKRGESLGIIARYYNINTRELMNGNGISNPDFVYVRPTIGHSGAAS